MKAPLRTRTGPRGRASLSETVQLTLDRPP
jgi:hypothetical protein